MGAKQIVIVSNIFDAHVDDVILELRKMGYEPVRLNSDDIPTKTTMTFSFDNNDTTWNGTFHLHTNGRAIDVADIRSVWWRRPHEPLPPVELSEQERQFAIDEIDNALNGLWASINCYWISHPNCIRRASWKGEQLQRAARMGFEVPRTLITTDPTDAHAFLSMCKSHAIYKVMSNPFLAAPKLARRHPEQLLEPLHTGTTLITEANSDLLDSVRLAPCMFQEYIPKRVELRVTVIGDEVFAAEIDSQAHEKTRIDWRHFDIDILYRKISLPTEISEKCLQLVKSYGLCFSAMDFILTPEGRYVFLESNPNGQFIFVERLVPELRMTEALASCLARGSS